MDAPLIWHIEKYLKATGMAASLFGREAAKDPKLVFDLRNGRVPGGKVTRRVSDYMATRGTEPVPQRTSVPPAPRRTKRRRFFQPEIVQRADIQRELKVALRALIGDEAEAQAYRERLWASATFTGARHYWTWKIGGDNHGKRAAELAAAISTHEFTISGHLVADALVTDIRTAKEASATIVTLEILTLEYD